MPQELNWIEYTVFSIMLALSALIGIYFGCIKGGQNSVEVYLFGGKHMTVFPIAMSLISSYISGITILGIPTEIYTYGTQYMMTNAANIISTIITATMVLPVFYNLQLLSIFEYMELRFDHRVRKVVSLLFTIFLLCYVPIVIYGPALAINELIDINIHAVTSIICIVCIFYTTLGGIQAVVWSDTLQGAVMIGATILVMILGFIRVGGIKSVIDSAIEGDRFELFNMNPDPTIRLTFWMSTISFTMNSLSGIAFSPSNVQRFIALPTLRQAKISLGLMCFGVLFFLDLSAIIGLVIYAEYKGCDPLRSNLISRPDQIFPNFVLLVAKGIPGLTGLFLAGVVSAALSTMSTCLNTLAATFYEDFLEPLFPQKPDEKKASFVMKILVILFGAICTCLVAIVDKLGAIVEVTAGFGGVTSGTSAGLFLLGLFFPWTNSTGALVGGTAGLFIMLWILIGSTLAKINGQVMHPTKPLLVDQCLHSFNLTTPVIPNADEVFYLFRISFFTITLVGCVLVVVIGLFVSYLTGFEKLDKIDHSLLSPVVHRFLPKKPTSYDQIQMKNVKNNS